MTKHSFSETAIIIPVHNEAPALPRLFQLLADCQALVIFVDNASIDDSFTLIKHSKHQLISEHRLGYGHAIRAGFAEAHRLGKTIGVVYDADASDNIMDISTLTEPIYLGLADFCLSDRSQSPHISTMPPHQRFGNQLAVFLMRLLTDANYSDMGPLRAIRLSCYQQMELQDDGYGWNVEMQLRAAELQLRVREFPMSYNPRTQGESKISGRIIPSVRAGTVILKTVAKFALSSRRRAK